MAPRYSRSRDTSSWWYALRPVLKSTRRRRPQKACMARALAAGIGRDDSNVVALVDGHVRGANEVQAVHVTCVPAGQPRPIGTDDTADENGQLLREHGEQLCEGRPSRQHDIEGSGPGGQACSAE